MVFILSSFVLKIIAIISMFIDHLGYLLPYDLFLLCHYFGRIAFPIFAFQISEGYYKTKNLRNYFLRLGIFAIISEIPFILYFQNMYLNIFFTLFLGLFAIFIYDKSKNKLLGFSVFAIIACIAQLICTDYGAYGVCIIFLFFLFKENKLLMNLSFIFATIIRYIVFLIYSNCYFPYFIACATTLSSLVFINLYNRKQGRKVKYILYFFYPFHLLVFAFIKYFILL